MGGTGGASGRIDRPARPRPADAHGVLRMSPPGVPRHEANAGALGGHDHRATVIDRPGDVAGRRPGQRPQSDGARSVRSKRGHVTKAPPWRVPSRRRPPGAAPQPTRTAQVPRAVGSLQEGSAAGATGRQAPVAAQIDGGSVVLLKVHRGTGTRGNATPRGVRVERRVVLRGRSDPSVTDREPNVLAAVAIARTMHGEPRSVRDAPASWTRSCRTP